MLGSYWITHFFVFCVVESELVKVGSAVFALQFPIDVAFFNFLDFEYLLDISIIISTSIAENPRSCLFHIKTNLTDLGTYDIWSLGKFQSSFNRLILSVIFKMINSSSEETYKFTVNSFVLHIKQYSFKIAFHSNEWRIMFSNWEPFIRKFFIDNDLDLIFL